MIKSFRCKETKKLFDDEASRRFSRIQRIARRRLEMLEAAIKLEDLKTPPGNRLEALKGNRKGQYSIRINDQFRICFKWKKDSAYDVEIVDYH
ncbi:type II toxin-antitoxin system RelE/ParE family toxin [Oligoflexia bacterium]|nr:type II toxin-antitoxin system RelE/ParE family toxin [Oligoflexia bacterium]